MPYKPVKPINTPAPPSSGGSPTATGDILRLLLATGLRVVPPIIGTAAGATLGGATGVLGGPAAPGTVPAGALWGGAAGGALGGGIGEYLAEKVEPYGANNDHASPGRIGVASALSAIPGGALVKQGKTLVSALRGAALGYAGTAGNKLVEGKSANESLNPTQWSGMDFVGPVMGGAISGGFSKIIIPKPQSTAGTAADTRPTYTTRPGESGQNVHTVEPVKGARPESQPSDLQQFNVNQEAARVATAKAKPMVKATVNRVNKSIGQAVTDTRPSTTTPTEPLTTPAMGDVVTGTEPGSRFSVTEPTLASPEDTGPGTAYPTGGDYTGPSEATQAALARSANKRMGTAAIQRARTTSNQLANREAAADLQNTRSEAGGTDLTKIQANDNKAAAADVLLQAQAAEDAARARAAEIKGINEQSRALSEIDPAPRADEAAGQLADDRTAAYAENAKRTNADIAQSDAESQARAMEELRGTHTKTTLPSSINETIEGPGQFGGKAKATFRSTVPDPDLPPEESGGGVSPVEPRHPAVYKKFTNKVEADIVSGIFGGEVHQVGPRNYRIRFPEDTVVPETPSEPLPLTPDQQYANGEAPPPFKPSTPVVVPERSAANDTVPDPNPNGNLTPDEFRRYMDVRPNGPNNGTRSSEVNAEYLTLHKKLNGQPEAIPPTTVPPLEPPAPVPESTPQGPPPLPANGKLEAFNAAGDADLEAHINALYGEDGPLPKINPNGHGTMPAEAPPAATPEAEPPLPGIEPTVNPDAKPVAELPFTLEGQQAPQAPPTPEPDLLSGLSEPEAPKAGTIPARLYRSPLEAAGEGYGTVKAAKKAGEKVPEEGRRVAATAAQRITKEAKGKEGFDSSQLVGLPPEQQDALLAAEVKKFFKNQKGAIPVMPIMHLAGGLGGAAVGATQTPDDPLKGALIGGAAGALAPSAIRAAINALSTNPNASQPEMQALAGKVFEAMKKFGRTLPEYQRFALLSDPVNLPINAIVGPWGSAVMGSIENAIKGGPWGVKAFKLLMNPKNFLGEYAGNIKEARLLIADANERTEGQMASNPYISAPANAMTAGDVTARNILMRAGATPEETRTITMTSSPETVLGKKIEAFKKRKSENREKGSILGDLMLPFYRTAVNQLEQSAQRTPFLGILAQASREVSDDVRTSAIKQGLGGVVELGSFALGTQFGNVDDRDPVFKAMRKFMNEATGQYGTGVSLAFIAGQAYARGKSIPGAVGQRLINGDLPMPTPQPIMDAVSTWKGLTGQGEPKVPGGVVPGVFNPNRWETAAKFYGGIPLTLMNMATGAKEPPPPSNGARPSGASYRPVKPIKRP